MKSPNIEESIREKYQQRIDRADGTLAKTLGIEMLEISKDRLTARMPVDGRTKQPFGLLHGGASVALAESLASVGAWLNVDEKKYAVVGMEINANHIRAVRDGWVVGEALPIHKGAKTQIWEIKIRTESGKLTCISRCTLAVIDLPKHG